MWNFNFLILVSPYMSKLMLRSEVLVWLCYNVTPLSRIHLQLRFQTIYVQSLMLVRLSEMESNYSNIERELLGIVFSVTHFKHFTYGTPVTIISDHKPLVSLFKKSLTSCFPHLSRMLLWILDYDLSIVYQEGSKMHLSNALSRLHTHQPNKGLTLPGMDITVYEIEACTNFSIVSLGKIHDATLRDQDLQVLKTHITNGFPVSSNQCP